MCLNKHSEYLYSSCCHVFSSTLLWWLRNWWSGSAVLSWDNLWYLFNTVVQRISMVLQMHLQKVIYFWRPFCSTLTFTNLMNNISLFCQGMEINFRNYVKVSRFQLSPIKINSKLLIIVCHVSDETRHLLKTLMKDFKKMKSVEQDVSRGTRLSWVREGEK